jgi:hypothetical protein
LLSPQFSPPRPPSPRWPRPASAPRAGAARHEISGHLPELEQLPLPGADEDPGGRWRHALSSSIQVYFTPHQVVVIKFDKNGKNPKAVYAAKR